MGYDFLSTYGNTNNELHQQENPNIKHTHTVTPQRLVCLSNIKETAIHPANIGITSRVTEWGKTERMKFRI